MMNLNLSQRLYKWQVDTLTDTISAMLRDAYHQGVSDARANCIEVLGPPLHSFAPELSTLGIAVHQPAPARQPSFTESEPE
jgi:hypothetical protein